MLIDTHFHLDLMDNMQELIHEFRESTEIRIIAVGTTPKAYEREVQFCIEASNIRVGIGLHPQLVADRGQEIEQFLRLTDKARFIGEIGLDFSSAYNYLKKEQISCFRRIDKVCADEGNKVLSIHSVKSAGTVLDELESSETINNCICILHWFSGTVTERERAIADGVYFSINPRMLRSKSGKETIKAVPQDKLLLETDAPFTMKFRHVADLKNELSSMVESISDIRGEDLRTVIEENSLRIWNG